MEARQANGQPLPAWLRFDVATGTIAGTPPRGYQGTVSIQFTARDQAGNSVQTRIDITIGAAARPQGAMRDAPPAWLDALLAEDAPLPDAERATAAAPAGGTALDAQLHRYSQAARLEALLRALDDADAVGEAA